MKKYFFNVFAAGVLATQAMGMGYNQDEALMEQIDGIIDRLLAVKG